MVSEHITTRITDSPIIAAGYIRRGGIVAFPTETVYGLGADIFDEAAISRVFEAKNRPIDNPLIAHIADLNDLRRLVSQIPPYAARFIESFFPGPLTLVMPKAPEVPLAATAGLDTIGVRMPDDPVTKEFLLHCGTPLVAPSANVSGRPSPTTWEAVVEDLEGKIDCVLQGPPTEFGLESTVVDCTADLPQILRLGAVPIGDLQEIVPETTYAEPTAGSKARSPGLRHVHYSPRAEVVLVDAESVPEPCGNSAFIGLSVPPAGYQLVKTCGSTEEYAHNLFDFFRMCDRTGIPRIFCETVGESGIGAALMDRLRRASEGRPSGN